MVYTLRITSILAILLALGLLGFSTVFGIQQQGDPEVEALLEAPTAVEIFQKSNSQQEPTEKDQKPALVALAEDYTYVPPPPKPTTPIDRPSGRPIPTPKRPQVSAKFELLAVNYFSSDPNLCSVLTKDTAGKYTWLNIGDTIGHQVVKDIQEGQLILDNNGQVETMSMGQKATHTLLAGMDYPDETVGSTSSDSVIHNADNGSVNLTPKPTAAPRTTARRNSRKLNAVRQRQNLTPEGLDKLRDIRENLSALEEENLGATPEEREHNARRVEEIRSMVRDRINSGQLRRGEQDGLREPPPDEEFDPDDGSDQ